jgi:hypothetical protein
LPHEKALVERHGGERFAIIGVNSDPAEKFRREAKAAGLLGHGAAWRHVLEASCEGPLQTRWRVRAWPTVFVLDGDGVIRAKHIGGEKLESVVRELLLEEAWKRH